jgi:hypothetical protein
MIYTDSNKTNFKVLVLYKNKRLTLLSKTGIAIILTKY